MAGRTLFDGEDDMEVFRKLRAAIVPPLGKERAGLPPALIAIVNRALAEEPVDRYATAREFARDLSKLIGGSQSSGDAQFLLARAVRDAKGWLAKKGYEVAPGQTAQPEPSWQDIEMHFSTITELPLDEEDDAVDIWFSKSDIKLR